MFISTVATRSKNEGIASSSVSLRLPLTTPFACRITAAAKAAAATTRCYKKICST
jgi:hypothetical protein